MHPAAVVPARNHGSRRRPRLALIGTYPPTRCGIASYSASLFRALTELGVEAPGVVRVLDRGDASPSPREVVAAFHPDDPASVEETARLLAPYDAVIMQHEYGLYGPFPGLPAADLVERIQAPVIVTLHTVTDDPSHDEREIIQRLASKSARIVVLSDTAHRLLIDCYRIEAEQVRVVPHGTSTLARDVTARLTSLTRPTASPLLLTWGLIGPGKGLDWALAAAGRLRESFPDSLWVVAGQTHPKVVEREGESYRNELRETIRRHGVESHVELLDGYLTREQINGLIRRASVVVLPYDSTKQTSSGVLVEAVTAGVPVVATAFPHAVELARQGAALTVPHRDPIALAEAITGLLADPEAGERMVATQRRLSSPFTWEQVATRYLALVEESTIPRAS